MNDPGSVFSRAKRTGILQKENDILRAENERLKAQCQAYRQLVDQFQEEATNRRALEQAKRRAEARGAPAKW